MINIDTAGYGLARDGVTDDSAAFVKACQAAMAEGVALYIPGGGPILLTDAASQNLQDVAIVGDGLRDIAPSGVYGRVGSQIWLTGTTKSPFLLGGAVRFEGINFFWPQQTEAAAAANGGQPIAYPPLFGQQNPAAQVNRFDFIGCQVTNAYDFLTDTGTAGNAVLGALNIHRNHIYAIRNCFTLQYVPEVVMLSDNLFSWGAYQNVVNGSATTCLKTFSNQNGTWLKVIGDAAAGAQASTSVQGFFSRGDYVLGYRYGIRVTGGMLDISEVDATSFDNVPTVLSLDGYGNANELRFRGGKWFPTFVGQNEDSVAVVIDNPGGSLWASVSFCDINVPFTAGSFATVSGGAVGPIAFRGVKCTGIGHVGARSSGYHFLQVNAPNAFVRVDDCDLRVIELPHADTVGIEVDAVAQLGATGTTIGYLGTPLVVNAAAAGVMQVTACCSYGSQTAAGITGAASSSVMQANNYWT